MENPFGSLLTAMITPFDENLMVDHHRVWEITKYLFHSSSEGIVIAGTTGESPSLNAAEKYELFRTAVNAVEGKMKVIAGTGANSTKESIEMSIRAEEAGVDGIMLVTPYYNKPTQDGLYHHFKSVAEAVSLPIMLYNVPSRTGVNMAAETCLRLAEIDNIVAVKEASGDLGQVTKICSDAPDGFAVYSGDDMLTLPILSVGGVGVVSVASHLAGANIKKMIDAFFAGEINLATEVHQNLAPLFNILFIATNPIPLKEALRIKGLDSGKLRLPLTPLPADKLELLNATMLDYGLLP